MIFKIYKEGAITMNKKNSKKFNEDEKFYKSVCEKYVETMSKEMLLEIDNKILHIFIEDEYIDLKEDGKPIHHLNQIILNHLNHKQLHLLQQNYKFLIRIIFIHFKISI